MKSPAPETLKRASGGPATTAYIPLGNTARGPGIMRTEVGLLGARGPGLRGEREAAIVRGTVLLDEVQTLDADDSRAGRRGFDASFPVHGVGVGDSVADQYPGGGRVPGCRDGRHGSLLRMQRR